MTARSSDRDGDPLQYRWLLPAGGGTLDSETNQSVKWTLPSAPGTHVISVVVFDGTEQRPDELLKRPGGADILRGAIAQAADGDARRLLNLLEQIGTAAASAGATAIDGAFVDTTLAQTLRRFDKGGDAFYDQISALHKAVRGSSPDAALYWFCRMVDGGADARYLARRLVRMAWEDVGLADPRAVRIALDASETFERLGAPEGELALAQAVLYLAMAAKSNAGYLAYNVARRFIASDASRPVPAHLRNAPTRLMKNLGYGKDYSYAHDQAEAYAAGENYFPEGMPAVEWYRPVDRGLEIRIGEKLAHLRTLDRRARGEEKE